MRSPMQKNAMPRFIVTRLILPCGCFQEVLPRSPPHYNERISFASRQNQLAGSIGSRSEGLKNPINGAQRPLGRRSRPSLPARGRWVDLHERKSRGLEIPGILGPAPRPALRMPGSEAARASPLGVVGSICMNEKVEAWRSPEYWGQRLDLLCGCLAAKPPEPPRSGSLGRFA
jgi:hypothetical protein